MRRYWNLGHDGECKEITGRRKKKHAKPSHSVWRKILILRRKLIRSIEQIRLQIAQLSARIIAQQEQVNARINALQEQVNGLEVGQSSSVLALLRGRLNTRITVVTTAGSVFGTLVAIGEDFIQIAEPNGSIVIIPFRSLLSIA
ncbi:hypothetical protein [Paenibacillus lautus]|uniref:hypothetical protein n=1 Tax=Paenibacillus lautus TaxID=1401 RepID=UPI001FE71554|nr:hypothetical protein [Paenibacillus lautus]